MVLAAIINNIYLIWGGNDPNEIFAYVRYKIKDKLI